MSTDSKSRFDDTGLIIVDHGSRRAESNDMLIQFVEMFRSRTCYAVVEPAHMELAEPSIDTAFARCVQAGAKRVAVMPYFLSPGRHWNSDIPCLTKQAASKHTGVEFLVGAPIGLHPLMVDLIQSRVEHCLSHAEGRAEECDVCVGTGRCLMQRSTD
jgi:sirohydrochlorin ferrochelatase